MLSWIDTLPAGWFIRLAILRLAAQWRSVLTIIVGVLLAAIIGASVPLYTASIAQVGMVQRLQQRDLADVQIHARISLNATVDGGYAATWEALNARIDTALTDAFAPYGDWRARTVNWGESSALLPVRDGEDIPEARLRVAYYDALESEVELTAGVWPTDAPADGVDLEILLTERVADALNLTVGDQIVLDQRGWDSSRLMTAQVSGLILAADIDSPFLAAPSPLRNDVSNQWQVDANALTTRATFTRINAEFIPETRAQNGWRVQLDHDSLDFAQIEDAIVTANAVDNLIEGVLEDAFPDDPPTLVFNTELGSVLSSYRGEVDQLNAPFSLLLLQLGALVLFFLVVMGALVRRGERREIAMLQSRGAPDQQILLLRGVETAIICVVAVLASPWIARQLLIVFVPLLTDLDSLVLTVQSDSYLYAGGAAFVALLALTVTLIPMLRVPLVQAGGIGQRSGGQTWWQRYYLDVVVLIIGGAALARLISQDTVLAENLSGDTQADPLLLLAPTLLVFALGSVLLRLFPVVMSILSRYFSGGQRPVEWTLSSWQVSREPLHYGRITFLLALAISIGWFAVSFQNTVIASQSDQAQYAVGADLRVQYNMTEDALPPISALTDMDGVERATVVTRMEEVPMSLGLGLDDGTLLAVDSAQFPQVAYWRNDLGPIRVLDEAIQRGDQGVPIPENTRTLSFDALMLTLDGDRGFTSIEGEFGPQPHILALYEVEIFAQIRTEIGALQLIQMEPDREAYLDALIEVIDETLEDPAEILVANIRQLGRGPLIELGNEIYPDGLITLRADLPDGLENARFEGLVIESSHPLAQNTFSINVEQTSSYLVINTFNALDADGTLTELDWAERDDWQFQPERDINPEVQFAVDLTPEAVQTANLAIEWLQTRASGTFRMGLNLPESATVTDDAGNTTDRVANALPTLVSRSFAELNEVEVGQQFNLFLDNTEVWFDIVGVIEYYPTLYNAESVFLITEQQAFEERMSLLPSRTIFPNEVWLDLSTDSATVINALGADQNATQIASTTRLEAARADLETDPLAVGLIGLLFFSFLIGIILSVVSLVTYATLTVQARRTELSVLRAIGLSPGRITSSIAIEQSLVMLTAILLGLIIGFLLSTQVLPALSTNTAGADVTPPFLIELEPFALVQYIIVITLILVTALAFSAMLVRRLTNAQALRQVEV